MSRPLSRFDRVYITAIAIGAATLFAAPCIVAANPPQSTHLQMAAKPAYPSADAVEARLASLHAALKITPDQENKWHAVADVMRENAKTNRALIEKRLANAPTMSAIDDLRAYMAIAEAHALGVRHLIPAMESLYDAMPGDQQKNADAVFSHHPMKPAARKSP